MRLIDSLGTTGEFSELFADNSVLEALMAFEIALARAQARLGMIPPQVADEIRQAKLAPFAHEARKHATLGVPFVNALKAAVDPSIRQFVHFGSTSQDLLDTALVLLLKKSQTILARYQNRLAAALRNLSVQHAGTIMMGRTLLQPALPMTFGYKAAAWYAMLARSWVRIQSSAQAALVLQFGGAAGTLASFGNRGIELAAALGSELHLSVCPPWHSYRDCMAALVADLGIYTSACGKIARDISLLMQPEFGELSEPGGASSAMSHKRNPAGSIVVLACATRVPGQVASYLSGMVQEHERAAGGMQAEWQTIASVVELTGCAVTTLAEVVENLTVHADRMRANIPREMNIDLGSCEQLRQQLLDT